MGTMSTQVPFEEFLRMKDESMHSQLEIVNAAVIKAVPKIDAAIKWKMYMYSFDAKWMNPLCAIDTTKKGISLRLWPGEQLSDPLGVLRFGSSDMGSWDIPLDAKIKPADITKYVREAAKIHKNREK
jgi:hypothetical protein